LKGKRKKKEKKKRWSSSGGTFPAALLYRQLTVESCYANFINLMSVIREV
jgi:hypothetical protein